MEQLFVCVVIVGLAAYGTLVLIREFAKYYRASLSRREFEKKDGMCLAILVKNREQDVEWIIRETMRSVLAKKCRMPVMVVDMESDDETNAIVKSLVMEYDDLELIENSEKEKVFENI